MKSHTCHGPQVQVQGISYYQGPNICFCLTLMPYYYHYYYYCHYCYYCCYPQPGNEEPFAIVDYTEKMVARVAELADSAKSARTIAIEVYEEYDSISKDQPRTIIAINK